MIPEELADMEFDETLSYKITRFLKENDPKMIFIYGSMIRGQQLESPG